MKYTKKSYQPFNKKGMGSGLILGSLAIIGVLAIAMFFLGKASFGTSSLTKTPLSAAGTPTAQAAAQQQLTFTEDTTVTFSSQDAYAAGTDAGVSNFVVQLGGKQSFNVADDGTETASPNDNYVVLIGNATTALAAGTGYYPTWVSGSIPDKGTHTINAGQYLVAGAGQVTFTFFNENDQVNTAQGMDANAQKTVRWKLTAADNACVGNPTVGGDNLMSYRYNTTLYSEVTQLDANSNPQSAVGTPVGISSVSGTALRSYTFPVVCDNADVQRKVLIKTLGTAPDSSSDEINMTVSDVSVDYNADTLAKIVGYTDEDNNDIGTADFLVAGLIVQ